MNFANTISQRGTILPYKHKTLYISKITFSYVEITQKSPFTALNVGSQGEENSHTLCCLLLICLYKQNSGLSMEVQVLQIT